MTGSLFSSDFVTIGEFWPPFKCLFSQIRIRLLMGFTRGGQGAGGDGTGTGAETTDTGIAGKLHQPEGEGGTASISLSLLLEYEDWYRVVVASRTRGRRARHQRQRMYGSKHSGRRKSSNRSGHSLEDGRRPGSAEFNG